MKKLATLILFTISFALISNAQIKPECLSGNCVNGKGIYKYSNGVVYEGDFVNNLKNGIGVMVWQSGDKYIGEWKAGYITGKGKLIYKDGRIYEGDFLKDQIEGKGTMIYKDGSKYIGDFKNGLKNGQGKYTYANGTIEEGEFINSIYQNPMNASYTCVKGDCNNGIGTYNFAYGPRTSYTGQFKDGKPDGEGSFIENDDIYKGHFEKGKKNGNGTLTVKNGSTYTGIWKKDELIEGTFTDNKGTIYTGQFTKDDLGMIVYHGDGVETSGRNMGRIKKGKWVKGDLTGKGVISYPNGYYMEANFKETANTNKKYYNNQNIQITEAEFDAKVVYQFCAEGDCFNGIGIGEANHGTNIFVGYWVKGKKEGFVAEFKSETDYYFGIWNADTLVKKIDDKEAGKYLTADFKGFSKLLNTNQKFAAARYLIQNCNSSTCVSGDCKNGIGSEILCNDNRYTGNFINGVYNGLGEFKWANGDIYNGDWVNGLRQGKGKFLDTKGRIKEGNWINDKFVITDDQREINSLARENIRVLEEMIEKARYTYANLKRPSDPFWFNQYEKDRKFLIDEINSMNEKINKLSKQIIE
jgi:hypothetical protein